jgi:hypothetical protein
MKKTTTTQDVATLTAAQLEKFTCWINAGAPNN